MNITKSAEVTIITSNILFDDIEKVKRFKPEALVLRDENNHKYFSVGTTEEEFGYVSPDKILFSSKNENGYAVVTVWTSGCEENAFDMFYIVSERLKAVEARFASVKADYELAVSTFNNEITTL